MRRKDDQELMVLLKKAAVLDSKTGNLKFKGAYVSAHLNIGWKGAVVSVPHSHVVWLLTHGRWPREGYQLDHIDDDTMNNAPSNLKEVTQAENQMKRRGRIVSRAYGTGKYGHGLGITQDKRDGKYYVTRYLSRGHHKQEMKTVKKMLGGYDSQEAAEAAVKRFIAQIEANGPRFMPEVEKRAAQKTNKLNLLMPKIRKMRDEGMTYQQIADATGFGHITIWKRLTGAK